MMIFTWEFLFVCLTLIELYMIFLDAAELMQYLNIIKKKGQSELAELLKLVEFAKNQL